MAFDAFFQIKLNGKEVEGECQDAAYKGWIEISSYSMGAENTLNLGSKSGGAGAGKATFKTLEIEKQADKTSPVFFESLCSGAHFDSATLELCRTGGEKKKEPFLKFEFFLVAVQEISNNGSEGDDFPTENLILQYGAMSWTYRAQDDKGKLGPALTKNWSRIKNNNTTDVK